jgi:hypothetical protein
MSMPTRTYEGITADVPQLVTALRERLERDEFEVLPSKTGLTVVVQARKTSKVRNLAGMSHTLTIRISPQEGGTVVEVGKQSWGNKAGSAAVGLLFAGATMGLSLAPAAVGAYQQQQLTDDIWQIVEAHMARRASAPAAMAVVQCGECGKSSRGGSAFCPHCGSAIQFERQCDGCGNNLDDPAARFCNRCGRRVEAAATPPS